jgi:hypothetical protein
MNTMANDDAIHDAVRQQLLKDLKAGAKFSPYRVAHQLAAQGVRVSISTLSKLAKEVGAEPGMPPARPQPHPARVQKATAQQQRERAEMRQAASAYTQQVQLDRVVEAIMTMGDSKSYWPIRDLLGVAAIQMRIRGYGDVAGNIEKLAQEVSSARRTDEWTPRHRILTVAHATGWGVNETPAGEHGHRTLTLTHGTQVIEMLTNERSGSTGHNTWHVGDVRLGVISGHVRE